MPRESAGSDPPLPLYEIDLSVPGTLPQLVPLDLDFLEARPGRRARVLGWPGTAERLHDAGISFRLVSADYGRDVALREGRVPPGAPPGRTGGTAPVTGWNVPPIGNGSFGGFWSLAEVNALLDSLSAVDPLGIVGPVVTIGTSIQGRPIRAVLVTDFSRAPGTRPAVLYTALTHAREPEGMQALLYFLSGLLQGYGTDPEIAYLVQEREMWFVPVVNPDGYERNYNTWLNTGAFGFWRKNLRNNDNNPNITNKDGVDLNRNFGYAWGYDNVGSSSSISSETYRGTAAFSEPETQALRDFCIAKHFRTAENFHTFGEYCLYPWSHIQVGTPDSSQFIRLGDERMEGVGYPYGRSMQILYAANGVATDWMYGEVVQKPKIFAFTTEIGNRDDEFWPLPERILPLAALHFRSNLALAYAAGVHLAADSLRIDSGDGVLRPGEAMPARFRLQHRGVGDLTSGDLRVTAVSGLPQVSAVHSPLHFPGLGPGAGTWPVPGDFFVLAADATCVPGTRVPLYLEIADDAYAGRDTLYLRVGEPIPVFADDAEGGLSNWTAAGTWGMETVDGDWAFSASPGAPYPQIADMALTLDTGLDLSGAVNAVLRFETRWDIESEMDFGRVEASLDAGATWTPLAGKRTLIGHGTQGSFEFGTQTDGEPGYFATQRFWTDEEVDLAPFAGHGDVRLRFRLTSDIGKVGEGWWLDDVQVLAYAPSAPVGIADGERPLDAAVLTAIPNPSRGATRIRYALDAPAPVRLAVYDVGGREIRVLSRGLAGPGERTIEWDGRDALGREVSSGAYFIRLERPRAASVAKVFVVH